MKTVSLLIRTLNRPVQLAEALASVRAQTYRPLEVVVVNDGGDSVEHVVRQALGDEAQASAGLRWRCHDHPQRRGRSEAANRALELATGDYAMFLDDDDWLLPGHIERLASTLNADSRLIAAYSDTRCYRDGKPLDAPFFNREFDATALAVENYLPIHAVLFHRRAWADGCRFSPRLDLYEGWHFWLQVARHGALARSPGASACYRLDISGVGGGRDSDYQAQYVAFLREALPVLSEQQLMHLHQSARLLQEAQTTLEQRDAAMAGLQQRITALENSRLYRLYPLERRLAGAKASLMKKSRTLKSLVEEGDWRGIVERMQRYLRNVLPMAEARQRHLAACQPGVDILCTRHTAFVARRISASLQRLGITPVRIISDGSGASSKRLCIVVCPQMFTRLPACYIAFQMEQSVSSRWFTQGYFKRLAQAVAVMDYSQTNLRYLQENGGLDHKQLYYVPISNLPSGALASEAQPAEPDYDVVFYGDANTPRRRAFLEAIEQRFSLLRVSEVFGDELYAQLRRARMVVNVHYYEGALLETTRLYECLSLGMPVVSESSVDIAEHDALRPWVRFTPIDDVDAMLKTIDAELSEQRGGRRPLAPDDDLANFHFYFTRMLVALGQADSEQLDTLPLPLAPAVLEQGVGLSLPETCWRQAAFRKTYPSYPIFPGLRHEQGWRGCALSYRYLARRAREAGLTRLDIREDDALLDTAAQVRWQKARELFDAGKDYDILCGLVADLAEHMQVLDAFTRDGEDYVVISCMTSMVCNRYGPKAIDLLAEWSFDDRHESNTIDRYLERQSIRVLVPLPFIATHRPDSRSTLWHFQNTTYDDMIVTSEQRLMRLAEELSNERGNG